MRKTAGPAWPPLKPPALLRVANDAPVVAKMRLGRHFAIPLDAGYAFYDWQPTFGSSKGLAVHRHQPRRWRCFWMSHSRLAYGSRFVHAGDLPS